MCTYVVTMWLEGHGRRQVLEDVDVYVVIYCN